MRRALLLAGGLGLLALALLVYWSGSERMLMPAAGDVDKRHIAKRGPVLSEVDSDVVQSKVPVENDESVVAFVQRASALSDDCGLGLTPDCEGDVCVALTLMPDLDVLTGWGQAAFSSPGFVTQAAMREVGASDVLVPCRGALSQWQVASVQVDQTEIWCGVPVWDGPHQRACSMAARRRGVAAVFDADARLLRF